MRSSAAAHELYLRSKLQAAGKKIYVEHIYVEYISHKKFRQIVSLLPQSALF